MNIGENIKTLRLQKGFTQKELGELSGTSENTVRQYELGKRKPRIEQLQKIAKILGVSPAMLVGNDWEEIQYEEAIKHQNPFLQYLYYLGYTFEYVKVDSDSTSILPENERRKPSVRKGGKQTIFTEDQFRQFEKTISDTVDYQVWLQNNKK